MNTGNPLAFGTRTYTWQHGRQLAETSKDGETVSLVYNEDGLRVQKTATSTGVTKYILHGKNIVHLTNGDDELHFFYDAQGKVAFMLHAQALEAQGFKGLYFMIFQNKSGG